VHELIANARLALPSGLRRRGWLEVRDGRIAALGEGDVAGATRDLGGALLTPGFVDVHVHGAAGAEFLDATPDERASILRTHARGGTTGLLATTLTASRETTRAAVDAIAAADAVVGGAQVLGIHLEGPYLSDEFRGAQDPEHLRAPDLEEIDALLAAGPIRLITLAPELPGATAAIERLVSAGVVVSVGHTGATYAEAMAAFDAGARHATHLFNGMRPLHHREPGVIAAALERDDVTCELICDGHHVDPAAIRLAHRLKGADRSVLITDAMQAAGLGDGDYRIGALPVRVRDGRAELADSGSLAGSTLTMAAAVRIAVQSAGIALADALRMASAAPARVLGLEASKGALAPGFDADLVVLDDSLEVVDTMVAGRWIGE
jgi:N-acetylglucosamine-6-phosphate deacetylase